MSPAAARLLLLGANGAGKRLAGIVAGIAVGVAMLMVLLGAYLHMPDRDARTAWQVGVGERVALADDGATLAPEPTDDTMLLASKQDYVDGRIINVTDVATTPGASMPFPSGLAPLTSGQFYASPAVVALLDELPRDQLGARYGQLAGILPDSALRGPDERAVLVSVPWETLAANPNARVQEAFDSVGNRYNLTTYRFIIAVGALAMLVPIVLLISIVSQLGAAQRREMLATVRLIGAGRRAVAGLSALEMGVASAVGGLLGLALAGPLRTAAAHLTINGAQSFTGDLTPPLGWTVATITAVAVIGAAVAAWQAYRDDVGALGASRERAEKPVTLRRALTLGIGLVVFAATAWLTLGGIVPASPASIVMIAAFAAIAFGLVLAGPWITRIVSRAYGRAAGNASAMVAAGRLSRHPRATFRSVAGLVAAVFLVSVFAGVVGSVRDINIAVDEPGMLDLDVVMGYTDPDHVDAMVTAAEEVEGVERVAVGYLPADPLDSGTVLSSDDARAIGAEGLPGTPAVNVDTFAMLWGSASSANVGAPVPLPADGTAGLEPTAVFAVTDGSPAAVERARTALDLAGDRQLSPLTRADFVETGAADITQELAVLAYVGMAVAIAISALALAVATIAAALERRRTFGLLRLAGMPVSQLRRMVATEAALPLASTLLLSAGLGFFVAWIMIEVLGNGLEFTWPDGRYWGALLGSAALAVLAVLASFGAVRRSTEIASTRFE